jgi:hypothetical protein
MCIEWEMVEFDSEFTVDKGLISEINQGRINKQPLGWNDAIDDSRTGSKLPYLY